MEKRHDVLTLILGVITGLALGVGPQNTEWSLLGWIIVIVLVFVFLRRYLAETKPAVKVEQSSTAGSFTIGAGDKKTRPIPYDADIDEVKSAMAEAGIDIEAIEHPQRQ